jgi:transcription initiation factor TFIIIB Brf1 subunit/transcription initiation factor TFIIB
MNKIALVKDLRKKGFSVRETAKKLGISENTVIIYRSLTKEKSSAYARTYREKLRSENLRKTAITQLHRFGLPNEWADLVMELVRRGADESLRMKGLGPETAVKSVLVLLCRRYKIPTPRKLIKETRKHPGGRGRGEGIKFSYQDFLEKLNGVKVAEPVDYINKFFSEQPRFKEVLPRVLLIAESLPLSLKQGRNPRVLAGACVYLSAKGLLLQREISEYFCISEVSLRYTCRLIEDLGDS